MQTDTHHHTNDSLGSVAVALGIAGFVPPFMIVASIAAIVCGSFARASSRGRVGIVLGVIGLLAPLFALFVYCVVLGYPFPIHRYNPGG